MAALAKLSRWSRHTSIEELRPLAMGTLYRTYLRRGVLPGRIGDTVRRAGDAVRGAPARLRGTAQDGVPFHRAVARLPRDQRAVLVGTYLGKVSDVEIANLIGRTPVAVRSLRYRGLRSLRATQGLPDLPVSADWVTRDTWTQETVHLPPPMPLPDSPRPAVPARPKQTRATEPAGAAGLTGAKPGGTATPKRAPNAARNRTVTGTNNASRSVNPSRAAKIANAPRAGRTGTAGRTGEVRRAGR